jgi:hypothetical protein
MTDQRLCHFHPVRGLCDDGNMTKRVVPAFVFLRRSDIEQQGGLLLAGILVVDLPKAAKENKRNMRLAEEIVQELTERAQSGVLGDELTVGWHGGHKPESFNRNDDVSLATWARGCLKITVRVGPTGLRRVCTIETKLVTASAQKWPRVSHFARAAYGQKNAPVDSAAPANGFGQKKRPPRP